MTQVPRRGFTLIELMLSMSFISILLLSIAMTAIQAGRMYNRGAILRSVNQSGRDVGDTIRRDFLQTNAQLIKMVAATDGAVITVTEGGASSGRFCLGQYSYIWNAPAVLDAPAVAKGSNNAIVYGPDGLPINFVRVIDANGSLCQQTSGRYPNELTDANQVTSLLKTQSDGQVVLAVHELKVTRVIADSSREGLYRVQFTLGTSAIGEINTANQSCRAPSDEAANSEFCAINQFDMIVRTNG